MDAAEADSDVKLYKASGELLAELYGKLPWLLREKNGRLRKWVIASKTSELMRLLDSFQEWPQLLDPILADLARLLVDAFLEYASKFKTVYTTQAVACPPHIEPLPRAICRLLYGLCKVRGYKIIVRLLNNEPRYIEQIVSCFRLWSTQVANQEHSMIWEERYILLLWLSHLMLAPFELSSISVASVEKARLPSRIQVCKPPALAENLLSLALQYLCVPSKDRESASILITRLALRGDMQRHEMPSAIISWCLEQMQNKEAGHHLEQYRQIGLCTLLFSLINSASDSEAASFLEQTFRATHGLATSNEPHAVQSRDSAPTRKLLVKTMRSCMVHSISLSEKNTYADPELTNIMLEDGIQLFLEWIADSDTPVRQTVSKAIGIIALKLDIDMSAEVVAAVLDCLNENILLEDTKTGQLIAATSMPSDETAGYVRNINAVDPLKWHGAMLTLGHLLFRRSPPVHQLAKIIEALLLGLRFEQRSNVGTSIGVSVRDAACFGVWSLARKYSTLELNKVNLDSSAASNHSSAFENKQTTLQTIATELVISSALDPSGNLRRGASAALQELIGRHPDAVIQGIPLVQIVDYHAVARRDRAVLDVAVAAAKVDPVYHSALLNSMLDWKGLRATDANSRENAAAAVGRLFFSSPALLQKSFVSKLCIHVRDLRFTNVGTTAAGRHGLLTAVAQILNYNSETKSNPNMIPTELLALLKELPALPGDLDGRVTAELVNVLRAVAALISAGARFLRRLATTGDWNDWSQQIQTTLHRCTTATDQDSVTTPVSEANRNMFLLMAQQQKQLLLEVWLNPARNKKSEFLSKGRLLSLGTFYDLIAEDMGLNDCLDVVEFLTNVISQNVPVEIKVNAMQSIAVILKNGKSFSGAEVSKIFKAIELGLADYTVDERGDVGSLLRLASIDAAEAFCALYKDDENVRQLIALTARLAAERMTKIRFESWKRCLSRYWQDFLTQPLMITSFQHQADVSSSAYYEQLAQLLPVSWIRDQLVFGLVSSAAVATDDISRSCSQGVVRFLLRCEQVQAQNLLSQIIAVVVLHLESSLTSDDRDVVPSLDFLSFLFEQTSSILNDDMVLLNESLFAVLDKFQNSTISIQRTEAVVRLYSALSLAKGLRRQTLDQLTRKLLHRWPKVRQLAADAVQMHGPSEGFDSMDWNASATQNKTFVVSLRKEMGVAGQKPNVPRIPV